MSSRYLLVEIEGGYKAKAGNTELKSQGAGKLLYNCAPFTWFQKLFVYLFSY